MTSGKSDKRRQYSEAMKTQVVAECDGPGTSVAKVAMSHGINANVVRRWRQLAREGKLPVSAKTGAFMPVLLAAPPVLAAPADIRVDLRRGATVMTITWPVAAAADFGLWTRELLR